MTYDTVEIEDMDWDEELQAFTYQCPCGDLFQITLVRSCLQRTRSLQQALDFVRSESESVRLVPTRALSRSGHALQWQPWRRSEAPACSRVPSASGVICLACRTSHRSVMRSPSAELRCAMSHKLG